MGVKHRGQQGGGGRGGSARVQLGKVCSLQFAATGMVGDKFIHDLLLYVFTVFIID